MNRQWAKPKLLMLHTDFYIQKGVYFWHTTNHDVIVIYCLKLAIFFATFGILNRVCLLFFVFYFFFWLGFGAGFFFVTMSSYALIILICSNVLSFSDTPQMRLNIASRAVNKPS